MADLGRLPCRPSLLPTQTHPNTTVATALPRQGPCLSRQVNVTVVLRHKQRYKHNSPACPFAVSFWVFLSFCFGSCSILGPAGVFFFAFCGVCWVSESLYTPFCALWYEGGIDLFNRRVGLSYLSQTSGRVQKPDPQDRIRAIGQTSGGTAAFSGQSDVTGKVKFNAGYRPHGPRFTTVENYQPRAVVANAAACFKSPPADLQGGLGAGSN